METEHQNTIPDFTEDQIAVNENLLIIFKNFTSGIGGAEMDPILLNKAKRVCFIELNKGGFHSETLNKLIAEYTPNDLIVVLLGHLTRFIQEGPLIESELEDLDTLQNLDVDKLKNSLLNIYNSGVKKTIAFVQSFIAKMKLRPTIYGPKAGLTCLVDDNQRHLIFEAHMKLLRRIIAHPQDVKVINLKNHNKVTACAFDFLQGLLDDEHIAPTLIKGYSLLDVPENDLKADENAVYDTKDVITHLKAILPFEIVQYPASSNILGFTCHDGTIGITKKILSFESGDPSKEDFKEQSWNYVFWIVETVLHEMGHKKRALYQSDYQKSTPERFKYESGIFVESQMFGENVTVNRNLMMNPSVEMKTTFFTKQSWHNSGFLDKFFPNEKAIDGKANLFLGQDLYNCHQTWDQNYFNKVLGVFEGEE